MKVSIKLYLKNKTYNPLTNSWGELQPIGEIMKDLESYRERLCVWGGAKGSFYIEYADKKLAVEYEDLWNFLFGSVVSGIEATLAGKVFTSWLMENDGKNYATEPLEDGNVLVYIWECIEGYMYSGGKDPNEPRDVLQTMILPAAEYYCQAFGCAMEFWEYQRLLSGEEEANRVRPFLDEVRIKLIERGILA